MGNDFHATDDAQVMGHLHTILLQKVWSFPNNPNAVPVGLMHPESIDAICQQEVLPFFAFTALVWACAVLVKSRRGCAPTGESYTAHGRQLQPTSQSSAAGPAPSSSLSSPACSTPKEPVFSDTLAASVEKFQDKDFVLLGCTASNNIIGLMTKLHLKRCKHFVGGPYVRSGPAKRNISLYMPINCNTY